LILVILAAGALPLAWPRPALAAPDLPVYPRPDKAIFSGDQSLGIWSGRDFVIPLDMNYTIEVRNLTQNITPVPDPTYPSVPFPYGIFMSYQGQDGKDGSGGVGSGNDGGDGLSGVNLTVNYEGGKYRIQTQDQFAHGIIVQSQGGKGGNGGVGALFGGDGGNGGQGGNGGSVTVTSSGAINTAGEGAVGLYAQSSGGDGGHGGNGGGIAVGNGGDGSQGGNGGSVTVTSSSDITTQGNGACGLYLQSQGGDGGQGGGGYGANGAGGAGGHGGSGRTVTVTNNGVINTAGEEAYAIYAESLGGDGGNGATGAGGGGEGGDAGHGGDAGKVHIYCNQGSINTTGKSAHGIYALSRAGDGGQGGNGGGIYGDGGDGGVGGTAGNVHISNQTQQDINITTSGDQAYGLVARSLGGAGGDGGTGGGLVGQGGGAKGSGPGGNVEIDWYGTIATQGAGSRGIFAQSVGGFAGSGGSGGGLVAFGASGNSGGDGGQVAVTLNNGAVTTQGDDADAIFVQSVGGGGGSGGAAGGLFSFGGTGDAGGNGGPVTVTNNSQIQTAGDFANGIFAQSVGGGGGEGGNTGSVGILDVSMGGQGGSGGYGGMVQVANSQAIDTAGFYSAGIFAQSAGGGGGAGGYAVSVAGGVTCDWAIALGGSGGQGGDGGSAGVTNSGAITTQGDLSHGISATSIGGGGGCGGFSIAASATFLNGGSLSMGGSGGGGGDGGQVTLKNSGAITTSGFSSSGLLALSLGGGGGAGGYSISGSFGSFFTHSCNFGGSGGDGGSGGEVVVANTGAIVTTGDSSYGIMAASVGGGGGAGGFNIAGSGGGLALNVSLGGSGGSGGDGGPVGVVNTGDITTSGLFSSGIMAQSTGGGGGAGSYSIAGALGLVTPHFSLGGSGGEGGNGEEVGVVNTGHIVTNGELAYGILAQSVGGGGGNGGFSVAAGIGVGSVGVSLGGSGTSGGHGGAVEVFNRGAIETMARGSHGILAQSVGGAGGAGGSAGSLDVGLSGGKIPSASVAVTVGGQGGSGGDAANVRVDNQGNITTHDQDAYGINAQSVGGGGGDGGNVLAVAAGTAQNFAFDVGVAIGGFGGDGGNGAQVTVTNEGVIETFGNKSLGIYAQSIGGGGGHGGGSIAGTLGVSNKTEQLAVSVGGFGGGGGDADLVSVTSTCSVITHGDWAVAIQAQSIGGGGGNGGLSFDGEFAFTQNNNFSVSVGGWGGQGGDGGEVQVTTSGVISTGGNDAHGILAQSIGGGGGVGNFSGSADLGFSGKKAYSLNLAVDVGGSGGTAGSGGSVTVDNQAAISTLGENSCGIYAQSLGGGGGAAGGSFSGLLTLQLPESGFGWNLTASVGGHGGDGNHGGTVEVTNQGNINTSGALAHGILAQSIGGGGGSGGDARSLSLIISNPSIVPSGLSLTASVGGNGGGASNGGQVTVDNSGDITTQGYASFGIFAQSVGGGGGTGGNSGDGFSIPTSLIPSSVELALGGSGGSCGNGGDVSVNNSGAITTSGEGSLGIFAQSVGGGGGVAGNGAIGLLPALGIGGAGGAGGDGGEVSVTNSGPIYTSGDGAHGIVAQSVGGGGGLAGNTTRFLSKYIDFGINFGYARPGGAGGDGGEVTVTNTGDITTQGISAYGIFAQSVGGGGGLAGTVGYGVDVFNYAYMAGSVGAAGSGGEVSVSQTGNITTQGEEATGIFAQSAGGQGSGGNVDIALAGNILCSGANANGIQAQSLGLAGNGDITITINSGTVQGGSGGIGMVFMDGAENTLTNYGAITTLDGITGMAIKSIVSSGGNGTPGNETINNYGVITGSVDLCAGINAFNNQEGATFNAGATVHLGTGNQLTNAGTFNPFGSGSTGNVGTVNLIGNFKQTSKGNHTMEFAAATSYDQVAVTGTANLRGKLITSLLNGFLPENNQVFTDILTAGTGISGTYDRVQNFSPSLLANVIYHANSVDLQAVRDYNNSGLGLAPHLRGVGAMLNSVADANSGDLNAVLRAIDSLSTPGQVAGALEQISHEKAAAMSILAFAGANLRARNLSQRITDLRFGKWQAGGQGGWPGAFGLNYSRAEGLMLAYNSSDLSSLLTAKRKAAPETKWGLYLTPALALGSQKSSAQQTGFSFNIAGFTAGADYRVRDDLLIGVASGYSHTGASFRGSGGDLETHTWPISVYGAYLPESFYAFGSLGYALNLFNQERNISFPGLSRQTQGSPAGHQFNLYGEAGYDLKVKPFVVTPVASLSYSHLWIDGFTESGAGALNMKVSPQNAESLQTGVGAKIAVPLHRGPTVVVPQVYATYQHEFADNSRGLDARLSQGSGTYTFQTAEPQRDFAVVGANVTIMAKKNFTIQLNYNAEVGRSNYTAHYMSAGLRWEF